MANTKRVPETQKYIAIADERIKFHKDQISQLESFKATAPVLFSLTGSGDTAPRGSKRRRMASQPISTDGKAKRGRPKGSKNKPKQVETPKVEEVTA